MTSAEKPIAARTFIKFEAFYDYLEHLLRDDGYVLVETCPLLDEDRQKKECSYEELKNTLTKDRW
ncbi:MAG: hypothetical protein H5U07_02775 [Candidatus Aminicenantes bacterium]|nr:hypothetical protein [Candidatus Aminicenantes bacterium]